MDADGLYQLSLESAKRNDGRYLVLNTSGVVLTDSFSQLNGKQLQFQEINEVLAAKKDMSFGFHIVQNTGKLNSNLWAI
jgi:hypothetical protein